MSSAYALIILIFTSLKVLAAGQKPEHPLTNQTPCCTDRLSTLSCQRLQLFNPTLFLYNCVHNADFAFVQCCRSCFLQKSATTLKLDYNRISENLLTNPLTTTCYDRRGEEWCKQLVFRKGFWQRPEYQKLSCASMPFSFRVCRKSCGYCSTFGQKAEARYDFRIATNHKRCSSLNQALAIDESKISKIHGNKTMPFIKWKKSRIELALTLRQTSTTTQPVKTTSSSKKKFKKTKKAKTKKTKPKTKINVQALMTTTDPPAPPPSETTTDPPALPPSETTIAETEVTKLTEAPTSNETEAIILTFSTAEYSTTHEETTTNYGNKTDELLPENDEIKSDPCFDLKRKRRKEA